MYAMARADLLGHGFIELLDTMGDDLAIVNNAKVSFDREMPETDFEEDREAYDHAVGLIGFMMRERHGSPFEAVEFKFRVKAPIFVFREWHRHRIAELNEESMRYSLKEHPEFYVPAPEDVRTQVGKPGAYRFEQITDTAIVTEAISKIELAQHFSFRTYRELVEMGVAKELARVVVPVGLFSTMIWKANLRSILNFLSLRMTHYTDDGAVDEKRTQAQEEIRVYADEMSHIVQRVCPIAYGAFENVGHRAP